MVNEYSCVCLHSDRRPQERKENLLAFKVSLPLLPMAPAPLSYSLSSQWLPPLCFPLSYSLSLLSMAPTPLLPSLLLSLSSQWLPPLCFPTFSQNGEVRFLICTDVAARGIDITGIPYVVNVMLPDDKQNYVHRIGRVGRAERMGLAISIVSKVKEKVGGVCLWSGCGLDTCISVPQEEVSPSPPSRCGTISAPVEASHVAIHTCWTREAAPSGMTKCRSVI